MHLYLAQMKRNHDDCLTKSEAHGESGSKLKNEQQQRLAIIKRQERQVCQRRYGVCLRSVHGVECSYASRERRKQCVPSSADGARIGFNDR